jgi:hypothetical protein
MSDHTGIFVSDPRFAVGGPLTKLGPGSKAARKFGVIDMVLAVVVFLAAHGSVLGESGADQWIVVTLAAFRPDLQPLIERRQRDGFHAVILDTAEGLSDGWSVLVRLKEIIGLHKGRNYVLLAGNSPQIPTLSGSVGRMKGQKTDAGYGIPGGDGAPTVPVGRFPARDEEELRAMVQKSLRFEDDSRPAPWRTRLLLMVGDPGGGMLADLYVQGTLDADLARLDASWSVHTIFNVPSSRFFYPRNKAREAVLGFLQEGQFFSVYLGHSWAGGMDFIGRDRLQNVDIPQGNGPFFTCGCDAFQAGQQGDGYGLAAMRNAGGPSALIGATGETYSAAGQLGACRTFFEKSFEIIESSDLVCSQTYGYGAPLPKH